MSTVVRSHADRREASAEAVSRWRKRRRGPVRSVVQFSRSWLVAGLCGAVLSPALAQDRSQNRSVVMTKGGIVASENPLASQAGAQILARGGNAIDAAVAANAVMGVVEPMMNGMGGDLFAIIYEAKTGQVYGLNASGWAPRA